MGVVNDMTINKKYMPSCPVCERKDKNIFLIEEVDTYCCKKCNIWLEKKCQDPKCFFCPYREEKPSLHSEFHDKHFR